jgi:hypothetical protein
MGNRADVSAARRRPIGHAVRVAWPPANQGRTAHPPSWPHCASPSRTMQQVLVPGLVNILQAPAISFHPVIRPSMRLKSVHYLRIGGVVPWLTADKSPLLSARERAWKSTYDEPNVRRLRSLHRIPRDWIRGSPVRCRELPGFLTSAKETSIRRYPASQCCLQQPDVRNPKSKA